MQNQSAHAARPGAINYVEGDAAIDNQPLNPDVVGSVELQKGQVLTTQAGKVEILLTPGVFLRVADNSTVKMVSPDLANRRRTRQGPRHGGSHRHQQKQQQVASIKTVRLCNC